MANIDCNDNVVLFLGNPNESGQFGGISPPDPVLGTPFFNDSQMGVVCAFGEQWFLDLINEFCLREKWAMTSGVATNNPKNLIENMTIGLIGSHKFVVDERAKLDRFMQAANRWHEGGKRNNSIWIYNQMNGEAGIRRSLIYNITSQDFPTQYPKDNDDFAIDMRWQIERHHVWENTRRDKPTQDNNFPYWGTVQRLLRSGLPFERGTAPNRIPYLHLFDLIRNAVTKRIIGTHWIGIKEDIGCGLDSWSPLWEAETGVNVSADTTTVFDGSPDVSANFYKNTTFLSTVAEVVRFTMTLELAFPALALADYEQFRGDYIVLARVRQTDPTMVITISMRYGWFDGGSKITVRQSPVVFVGEPFWKIVELGVISIPPDSGKQSLSIQNFPSPPVEQRNNLSQFSIDIIAGLSSPPLAGREMHIDALYMIPFERHAIAQYRGKFSPGFASVVNIGDDGLFYAVNEDDTPELRYLVTAGGGGAEDPISDYQLDSREFALPEKGSRIVYAANAFDEVGGVYKAINVIGGALPTDQFRLTTDYRIYPRWLTYRDE